MVIGIHIIIGMVPHMIVIGAPIAIIEFMASQRSFMRAIIDASAGIIFMTMPSFVISHDILHGIGIRPLVIGMGIIPPIIIGMGIMPIGMPPIIMGIGCIIPPIMFIGIMPGMPPIIPLIGMPLIGMPLIGMLPIGMLPIGMFVIGMFVIGMLLIGIPIIEPVIGIAFMSASSI